MGPRTFVAAARAVAAVAAVAELVACAPPQVVRAPPEGPDPAPASEHLDAPLTFGPVAHPAAAYDEVIAPRLAPADGGVRMGLQALMPEGAVLARDPRLDLAAAELAELLARGATPSDAVVQFALHAHGVVEPGHIYVGRGASAEDQLAALAPQLADKLAPGNARVAVAPRADLALVLVAYAPAVVFDHAPREVDGWTELAATLAPPYTTPHVVITHDDRAREPVDASRDADGHFHFTLSCALHAGMQWVAISGDDQVAPLAVVPISCGEPPPATYRVEPDRNLAATDVAFRIAALINRERIAARLAPLIPDAPATAAARAYAAVIARTKDVAHDIEGTTPPTRLAAAGRRPIAVSESTVKADDLREATEVLLDDPMYRRQVVDPKATHVSVGVVTDHSGELYIAIEYIEIPPPIDTAAMEARAAQQLIAAGNTRRTTYRGRRIERDIAAPPEVDRDLSAIARELAGDIALGESSSAVQDVLKRRVLDELGRYTNVDFHVVLITDPDRVDVRALLAPGSVIDNLGIGVVQSSRAGPNSGRAYLVVLTGRY